MLFGDAKHAPVGVVRISDRAGEIRPEEAHRQRSAQRRKLRLLRTHAPMRASGRECRRQCHHGDDKA